MVESFLSGQEYLKTKEIEKLIESMIESLVLEKPSDPVAYLANHLAKSSVLSFDDVLQLFEAFKQASILCDSSSFLLATIELVCSMLHCDRASLFLYDQTQHILKMVVGKGAKGLVLPEDSGLT